MRLPLKVMRLKESYIIRDDTGLGICTVYFDDDPSAIVTKRMSQDQAEAVFEHIARALTDVAPQERAASSAPD